MSKELLVNTIHLEYFIAAVESGSYSSASKALYVDASTISLAVSSLEAEVGGLLLHRAKTGVTPTSLGQTAYASAKQIILCIDQLKGAASVSAHKNGGASLRIGISSDPQRGQIVSAKDLASLGTEGVRYHFDSNAACVRGVQKGYLDAALVAGRPEDALVHSVGVCKGETLALISCAEGGRINFEHFRDAPIAIPLGYDYLFEAVKHVFSRYSASPHFCEVGWSREDVLNFIDEEEGIVLIADDPKMKAVYGSNMVCRIDKTLGLDIPIYYIWKQEGNHLLVEFKNKVIERLSKRH